MKRFLNSLIKFLAYSAAGVVILLAVAVGLVQGGSQALSRSLYGAMTPKAKTAEFFGFFQDILGAHVRPEDGVVRVGVEVCEEFRHRSL